MASNPVITQSPTPLIISTLGQVTYTDLSYNIIPDISNNPTYTLRTNVSDPTKDVFTSSTSVPQAFIPNSLFISTNLSSPTGMARDSSGNFYVANGNSFPGTISVYDSAGVYLPSRTITLNTGGAGPNWVGLRYLAFDESDNLYVSSESDRGIAYVAAGATTNDNTKTIFPYPTTYSMKCRGLAYFGGYLYISMRNVIPPVVVKYDVTTNNYLVLDVSGLVQGSMSALTRNPFYVSSLTPFLYLAAALNASSGGGIVSISEITGTPLPSPGGTGSATISTLIDFGSSYGAWTVVVDNSANLYVGIQPITIGGEIARVTPTGVVSNISRITLDSSGIGIPRGLLFDGSLNLYVTDVTNNRVIKSQPKTFVFGGPSIVNPSVNTGSSTTTYLYNTSSATSATNFSLNIASSSSIPVITQSPTPLQTSALGQVTYTDLSYNIVPDISNNPTYTLRTNVSDPTFDVFSSSTSVPQAFIPNRLFINSSNLETPMGIARDSVGNFYVANGATIGPFRSTIKVYDSTGTTLLRTITLNSGGSGIPGQTWVNLRWLAFDPSDNLYVTNEPYTLVDPSGNGIAYVAAGASTNTYANTIFPPPSQYTLNCGRGLIYYGGYLYIPIRQNSVGNPPLLIKYNVSTNPGAYLTLDLSSYLTSGGFPIMVARNPLYVNSSTPFLYLASHPAENKILSISEITGTESPSGGTGTATIALLYSFSSTQTIYSLVTDNLGNLYLGTNSQSPTAKGQIARVTPTGVLSSSSYMTLDASGIGDCRGLLFDGSLNLYVSDTLNVRVIKSQPKTFVFGGPSIVNPILNLNPATTTYLYNTTTSTSVTSFSLNIACFKKGTKILCENDMYIPIEELKTGDLVKTYKHGYQKVIMSAHSRLCDSVQSTYNKLYTYSSEKNPDLIEDLHLTGGHSLLLDTLTEEESTDMSQINWATEDFMVEDKYKLLACLSREFCVASEQHVEIYHFALEPPENAKSTYVYGVYANGILVESCSKSAMEEVLGKNNM